MKLDHLEPLVLEIIGNLNQNMIERTIKVESGTQYNLYNIQITKDNIDYDLKIIIWLSKKSYIRVINYVDSFFDDDFKIIILPELEEYLKLKLL